jgi:diacylglycerol kinase family enzyme
MVAGGGDGTLNAVASAIVCKKDVRFGCLPIGTLNHFAPDAGIPKDVALAVRDIVADYTRARGCGRGQWAYISEQLKRCPLVRRSSGCGKVCRNPVTANGAQRLGLSSAFCQDFAHSTCNCGRSAEQSCGALRLSCLSATLPMTPALQLGARPELDQGPLRVTMPTSSTRWGLLMCVFAIILGRANVEDIYKFEATDMLVANNRKYLRVAVDGKVLQLRSSLTYPTLPGALGVIVSRPVGSQA